MVDEVECGFRNVETGSGRNASLTAIADCAPIAPTRNRAGLRLRQEARAAQNAFRHGLNVPVLSDPSLALGDRGNSAGILSLRDGETLSGRGASRSQVVSTACGTAQTVDYALFVDPWLPAAHATDSFGVTKMVLGGLSSPRCISTSMRLGTCFPRSPLKVKKSPRAS